MRPEVRVAVRALRRLVERHERQLGDRLARPEDDRHAREVGDLERERALEARVDEAGGGVHDEAEPPQRRLALDPRDHVVGQLDVLLRAAEDELAGVDDERFAVVDLDVLGEVLRRIGQVDRADAVVVEDAERAAQPQVDAGRLDHGVVERLDAHATVRDQAADGAVGEDRGHGHRRKSASARR
jgi:hypothetical protein